jgi:SAM-dependent methyltransferase
MNGGLVCKILKEKIRGKVQMPIQKDLDAYDERYQRVYETGCRFWNKHQPHQRLLQILSSLPEGSKCIDLGCGEGHEARAIARFGHHVVAIDLSPTVIRHNINMTPEDLPIEYLVGDVTDLKSFSFKKQTFDLALDIGCLHMMNEPIDRFSYLSGVKRLLKPGGIFYLQDGLSLESVKVDSESEAKALQELKSIIRENSNIPRKIHTPAGDQEIILPLCPEGKWLSLEEYISELTDIGFSIISGEQGGGSNMRFEAIIIAKPSS